MQKLFTIIIVLDNDDNILVRNTNKVMLPLRCRNINIIVMDAIAFANCDCIRLQTKVKRPNRHQ